MKTYVPPTLERLSPQLDLETGSAATLAEERVLHIPGVFDSEVMAEVSGFVIDQINTEQKNLRWTSRDKIWESRTVAQTNVDLSRRRILPGLFRHGKGGLFRHLHEIMLEPLVEEIAGSEIGPVFNTSAGDIRQTGLAVYPRNDESGGQHRDHSRLVVHTEGTGRFEWFDYDPTVHGYVVAGSEQTNPGDVTLTLSQNPASPQKMNRPHHGVNSDESQRMAINFGLNGRFIRV